MLDGYLLGKTRARVTPTTADTIAQRHGIRIDHHSNADALEYSSSVEVAADGNSIVGTISGLAHTPRFVSVMGDQCDLTPAKHVLIMQYVDSPGRVGTIGTILGNANVNITTMQVSTLEGSDLVMVFMNIESALTEDVLGQLETIDNLQALWLVDLEATD